MHKHIYSSRINRKISSNQKGKVHSVWHLVKHYQLFKGEKYDSKWGKINQNPPKNDMLESVEKGH